MASQSILLILLLVTFINNLIVANKTVVSLENQTNVTELVPGNSSDKLEVLNKIAEKKNGTITELEDEDEPPQDKTVNGPIDDEEVDGEEDEDVIKDQGGGIEEQSVKKKIEIESRESEDDDGVLGSYDSADEMKIEVPSSIAPYNGNTTIQKIKRKELLESVRNKNISTESKLRQIFRKRPIVTRKIVALPIRKDIDHNNSLLRNQLINKINNGEVKLMRPSYQGDGISESYFKSNRRRVIGESDYENNVDEDDSNVDGENDYLNNDDDDDFDSEDSSELGPNISLVEHSVHDEKHKNKNNVVFEITGKITRKGITYFLGPNNVVYAVKKESKISRKQLKDQEDEPDHEIYINVGRQAEKGVKEEKGPNGENICRYGKVVVYTYGKCGATGEKNPQIIKIGTTDENENENGNEKISEDGKKTKKNKKRSKDKRKELRNKFESYENDDQNPEELRRQVDRKNKRKTNPTQKRINDLRKQIEKELKKMEKQRKKMQKKNKKSIKKRIKRKKQKQNRNLNKYRPIRKIII